MEDTSNDRFMHRWDVALSFAGEQRTYVEKVASTLRLRGIRVFYDDFEKVSIWGKDLYEHLDYVYRVAARYCVLFISEDYARKVWTTHERRSAQARALEENGEYVLPVRFDEVELQGLRPTLGYIDLRDVAPERLAEMIADKVGTPLRRDYLPPVPVKLFEAMGVTAEDERKIVSSIAENFMQSLRRMTIDERVLIAEIFLVGCKAEMPENIHASLDLIRRDLGISPVETLETIKGLQSVGFKLMTSSVSENHEEDDIVAVAWRDRTAYESDGAAEFAMLRSTEVAYSMLQLGHALCLEHSRVAVTNLDFSTLG